MTPREPRVDRADGCGHLRGRFDPAGAGRTGDALHGIQRSGRPDSRDGPRGWNSANGGVWVALTTGNAACLQSNNSSWRWRRCWRRRNAEWECSGGRITITQAAIAARDSRLLPRYKNRFRKTVKPNTFRTVYSKLGRFSTESKLGFGAAPVRRLMNI